MCLGSGQRMKEFDVAREITVKNICDPSLNLRPDLFIDLSTVTPCRMTLIQHIVRVMFKHVPGAWPMIPSQIYPPVVTMLIMSQKLWFKGNVIPETLVGILEDGSDEYITHDTHSVDDYDEDETEEYDDY